MTVFDIVNSFGLTIRTGKNRLDEEVAGGYAGDLLSDVIAHSRKGEHRCFLGKGIRKGESQRSQRKKIKNLMVAVDWLTGQAKRTSGQAVPDGT